MHQTRNHRIRLQHLNDPLRKIPCTTPGCVCKFIRYQDLNRHVRLDKHTIITNLPANDPPLSPHTSSLPGSQAPPSHAFEPLYPELEHLLDIPPENIFDHSGYPSSSSDHHSTASSPSGQPSVTPSSFNHPSTAPYGSHTSASVDESNSEASSSKSSPSSGAHSRRATVEDYVEEDDEYHHDMQDVHDVDPLNMSEAGDKEDGQAGVSHDADGAPFTRNYHPHLNGMPVTGPLCTVTYLLVN